MFQRSISLPNEDSFFLFGARGTGKSTLLRVLFPDALTIDLLDNRTEEELMMAPHHLEAMIAGSSASHIVIDEIQKIPKLLDEVHRLIEKSENKNRFIRTILYQ
jgi:predicted AAA+ superfamily ATPase